MPELRHLRYFLAVAEELNFTRAAERAGVSQQVLSSQIRQLEGELGVQLFDRSTHHVALTEAGRGLAERGRDVLAVVEGLWEEARLRASGVEGVLRLGFARSGVYGTTPRLIEAMREAHPQVEIVGVELASAELPRAARDGRADVVIVHWGEGVRGLFSRRLRRVPHGVVMRADDPLGGHDAVALSELADRPLLVSGPEPAPARRTAIAQACLDAGFEPELVAPGIPFDPTFRDVSSGRGVAIAPDTAQPTLPAELCWVPLQGGVLDMIATLAWDPARTSPVREKFVEVAEQLSAREGWSAGLDR